MKSECWLLSYYEWMAQEEKQQLKKSGKDLKKDKPPKSQKPSIVYLPLSGSIDIQDLKDMTLEQFQNPELMVKKPSFLENGNKMVGPDHDDYLIQVKELTEYYDRVDEAKKRNAKEMQEFMKSKMVEEKEKDAKMQDREKETEIQVQIEQVDQEMAGEKETDPNPEEHEVDLI